MKNSITLISIAVVAILLQMSLFTVDEREQALVFQFGEVKASHLKPGLKFKVPFLQSVVYYPSQALFISPPQQQIILADQKRLNVDQWQIKLSRFAIDQCLLENEPDLVN